MLFSLLYFVRKMFASDGEVLYLGAVHHHYQGLEAGRQVPCVHVAHGSLEAAASNNCHSPTQPQYELVLDLIMGRNPPHTTPPHTGTFKALPGNLGS